MFRFKKAASLDSIGIRAGTDKSCLRQDYLVHYQRMLEPYRARPITLLEIGVHNGASLRMWDQYLESASIVGIDIEPMTRRFAGGRVRIEIGSQADAGFLAELSRKYRPDVIIDDGSHLDEHQIFSFEHLFGGLQPGGLYIVALRDRDDQLRAVHVRRADPRLVAAGKTRRGGAAGEVRHHDQHALLRAGDSQGD